MTIYQFITIFIIVSLIQPIYYYIKEKKEVIEWLALCGVVAFISLVKLMQSFDEE